MTFFKAMKFGAFPHLFEAVNELSWQHNYNTRGIHKYRLPRARVLPEANCFLYQCVKFINSLPNDIRNIDKLSTFKRSLKSYLLD